jgi:hypothetical protein
LPLRLRGTLLAKMNAVKHFIYVLLPKGQHMTGTGGKAAIGRPRDQRNGRDGAMLGCAIPGGDRGIIVLA